MIDATTGQSVGKIAAVDDTTMNILFELEDGTLVPAAEELIEKVDQKKKQITIALPEGLIGL